MKTPADVFRQTAEKQMEVHGGNIVLVKFALCGLTCSTVFATTTMLFAQAAATPPDPPAKDREAHSKSHPQEQAPRVRTPNTDAFGNKALPPSPDNPVLDPDDLQSQRDAAEEDAKPSEIRSTITPRPATRQAPLRLDLLLSTNAAIDSQKEIILGSMAEERAQLPAVKDFGMTMAHDHAMFLEKLRLFAPDASKPGYLNRVMPLAPGDEVASTITTPAGRVLPANTIDDKTTDAKPSSAVAASLGLSRPAPGGETVASTLQLMHIQRDTAGLFLTASKELLDQKRGADFDKCFLAQQITLHLDMKCKLMVARKTASRALAAILNDGEQMVDAHLDKAKLLMKALEVSIAPTGKAPTDLSETGAQR